MMVLATVSGLENNVQHTITSIDKTVDLMSTVNHRFDGTVNFLHPMALATKISINNTFTVKQMLQQEDVLNFIQIMMKEVDDYKYYNH